MIPIFIDISEVASQFNLDQSQVDDLKTLAVERVAQSFQQHWKAIAGRELKQTREQYKNAIRLDRRQNFSVAVYLDPDQWLPNALEMGFSPFDMKVGFLKSSKVKWTKDNNPYLTIPFRFATPTAIADSPVFSGRLPTAVHQKAKSIAPQRRGLKLTEIPEEFHIPKSVELRKRVEEVQRLKPEEKTSIYEGVRKTEGGYINFRRVSLSSHEDSWIHPGFNELNLAQKAMERLEPQIGDIVGDSVDDFLDSLGL